jgi:hypothetical protein
MHGANTMGTSKPDATITASHADGLTVQLAGPEHLGDLSANMIAMAKVGAAHRWDDQVGMRMV